MTWTEEMKKTLKTMANENISYTNIAKRMSAVYSVTFTKGSVIGMAGRIGVPRRPSPIKSVITGIRAKLIHREPVTIYQLGHGMCKWPMGEPYDKPPFMYCGKNTEDSCSWCPTHRKKAFTARWA